MYDRSILARTFPSTAVLSAVHADPEEYDRSALAALPPALTTASLSPAATRMKRSTWSIRPSPTPARTFSSC